MDAHSTLRSLCGRVLSSRRIATPASALDELLISQCKTRIDLVLGCLVQAGVVDSLHRGSTVGLLRDCVAAVREEKRVDDTVVTLLLRALAGALDIEGTRTVVAFLSGNNWSATARFISAAFQNGHVQSWQLIQFFTLDRSKLATLIAEVSAIFLQSKQHAVLSDLLRLAILNWIALQPAELAAVVSSNARLHPSTDVLFEYLSTVSEDPAIPSSPSVQGNSKTKIPFFTTMLLLCLFTPDVMNKLADASVQSSKKVAFIFSLRSALRSQSPKVVPLSLHCFNILLNVYAALPPQTSSAASGNYAAYRSVVADITDDIFDTLTSSYAFMTPDVIDSYLIVDVLSALWKNDAARLTSYIRTQELNLYSVATLARVCVQLSQDSSRIESLYPLISGNFRKTFLQLLHIRRVGTPESQAVLDAALVIMQVWCADIRSCFPDQIQDLETLEGIAGLVCDPLSEKLRVASGNTISSFLRQRPDDLVVRKTGTLTFVLAALRVINDSLSVSAHQQSINLMVEIMPLLFKTSVKKSSKSLEQQQTAVLVLSLIAGYITLCSPDPNIILLGIKCMRQTLISLKSTGQDFQSNFNSNHLDGQAVALDSFVTGFEQHVLGRQILQKHIRTFLRKLNNSSTITIVMWGEIYRRSSLLEKIVATSGPDGRSDNNVAMDLNDENLNQWQSYCGFLAASSGVCTSSDSMSLSQVIIDSTLNIPEAMLKSGVMNKSVPLEHSQNWISRMIFNLDFDNIRVRESAREALSTDLSSALVPMVFTELDRNLKERLHQDEDPTLWRPASPRLTLLVEQSIMVIRAGLERQDIDPMILTGGLDIHDSLVSCGTYIQSNLKSIQNSNRLQVKLCKVAELVCLEKNAGLLTNSPETRKQLLAIIWNWVVDGNFSAGQDEVNDRHQSDIEHEALSAIAELMKGLSFSVDDSSKNSESSQLFQRYWRFLCKTLIKTGGSQAEMNLPSFTTSPDLLRVSPSSPHHAFSDFSQNNKEVTSYRESCLEALTNLVAANTSIGLPNALTMAYHEDVKIRAAFLSIIKRLLYLGAHINLLENSRKPEKKSRIRKLLVHPDLRLVLALCTVCPAHEIDSLAPVIMDYFKSAGLDSLMNLLKAVIGLEVSQTDTETGLFRRNSMASRLLSLFARSQGYNYLRGILSSILPAPGIDSLEIDPSRVSLEDLPQNLENLRRMAQSFVDAICNSIHLVPGPIKELCCHMQESVLARFPKAPQATAVSGFVFLRFICPAIVAPESVDLDVPAATATRDTRRGLLFITKIIQNLASNVSFGGKEQYMSSMNGFLRANISQVAEFLGHLCAAPKQSRSELQEKNPGQLDQEDLGDLVIHRFLSENHQRIGKELLTNDDAARKAYEDLCTFHVDKGDPLPAPPNPLNVGKSERAKAYDKMKRRFAKAPEEESWAKSIFSHNGSTKDDKALYHVNLSQILSTCDLEYLQWFIIKTLKYHKSDALPYEIVLDSTSFSADNELPIFWIQQLLSNMPSEVIKNLSRVYMLNPNLALAQFIKKLSHSLPNIRLDKIITPLTDLSQVWNKTLETSSLPSYLNSLASENMSAFHNVTQIDGSDSPVVMKIGQEYLQITQTKRYDLMTGFRGSLNEVLLLRDIDDVEPSAVYRSNNEFCIRSLAKNLYYQFKDRDSLLATLKSAISRARQNYKTQTGGTQGTKMSPADIPGTLLNVGLLSLCSSDETLRSSAFDLLCAVTIAFSLDVGNLLIPASFLSIPASPLNFVVALSEKMSSSVPTGLTIEFLFEVFKGFDKSTPSMRRAILAYASPWFPNLAAFCQVRRENQDQMLSRVRELIRTVIHLTVECPEVFAPVQSKLWNAIASKEVLVPLLLDEIVRYASDAGFGSSKAEAIINPLYALSSNVHFRGKVVARLRQTLAKTSARPTSNMTENSAWTEICTLLRCNLILSFHHRISIQLWMPELLFIISLLFGFGPVLFRKSVHGLLINVVQNLCIGQSPEDTKELRSLLQDLSEPTAVKLFGLMTNYEGSLESDGSPELRDAVSMDSLHQMNQTLLSVIQLGASNTDMCNAWKARWMSLTASTAFQYNSFLQSRAFVTLGALAQIEVDDDLAYQCLVSLRGNLNSKIKFSDSDCRLTISIMSCLARVVQGLPLDSRYQRHIPWIAISILQCGYPPLLLPAIQLLHLSLKRMESNPLLRDQDLIQILLASRQCLGKPSLRLDLDTGLNLNNPSTFAFGISAILSKGMRSTSSRPATHELLVYLFRRSIGKTSSSKVMTIVPDHCVGYILALLADHEEGAELAATLTSCGLSTAGTEGEMTGKELVSRLVLKSSDTTLLFACMSLTMLETASNEAETVLLYEVLAELSLKSPGLLSVWCVKASSSSNCERLLTSTLNSHKALLPKLSHLVNNTSNHSLLRAADTLLAALLNAVVKDGEIEVASYLERIGMSGILQASGSSFVTDERLEVLCTLCSLVVESVFTNSD